MKSQIEILLGEWGRWKRGENRTGLGYPSRSAFQLMRVDGCRPVEVAIAFVDDDVRVLDGIVDSLYPEIKSILTAHYVHPGPVKSKLDWLGVSRTHYYSALDFAHRFIDHNVGRAEARKRLASTQSRILS